MTALPRNLDEAASFLGAITPGEWASFRLGLLTVLIGVAIVGLVVWALLRGPRR